MRKLWLSQVLTSFLWIGLFSCTANAPNNQLVCKRSCGNRVIGGGYLRALPLSSKLSMKCGNAGASLPQQTFRFLVYEDTTATGSTTTGSSGTSSSNAALPGRIPKGGISFTPVTAGAITIDSEITNWCTDSCGIAEVIFTPTCAEQDVTVGIIVPGMLYDDGSNTVPATGISISLSN
jgi:hypothetical protein